MKIQHPMLRFFGLISCDHHLIATQLNSTRCRDELSCVGEVSIATQLNSTRLTCFVLIGCTLQLGQLHCRLPATVELRR